MPVYAELSTNEVVVAPGGEEQLRLLVRNLGDTTESFVVVPLGLCSGWTLIDPPNITLFAGEEQTLTITLRPPRSPGVAAGLTGLTLRVVPHGAPDETATVEAVVRVLAFSERRVTILQPVLRARRTAAYDVVVENLGNEQATCRLRLEDETGRLTGRCEPPSIGVEPGMNAAAQVKVRARRRRWRGGTTSLPFVVEATQEGKPRASAPGTLLQTPVLTTQVVTRLAAGVVAVGVAAAAWAWVVHPALDDAAADAVDDRIAELVPADSVPGGGPTETTVAVSDGGPTVTTLTTEPGTEVAFRLAPAAALGATATEEYTVPDGRRLEMTDVVLQNPQGDQGRAVLSRGGEVLLSWNLVNVIGDDVKQFVTPLTAGAGEVVSFTVTCSAVGDPTAAACTPSVSISGRLVAD
jgi:hypothetical protein